MRSILDTFQARGPARALAFPHPLAHILSSPRSTPARRRKKIPHPGSPLLHPTPPPAKRSTPATTAGRAWPGITALRCKGNLEREVEPLL
ncbi:hypothetical protein U9M48_020745 [Paspalum notatum var. saurae]|uniref:Uncharacterized protein n=1 Tax=Paspalum notatum var. saurae TaxID=547442 RepID=A0AAQ3TFR7_PASNO